MHREAVVLRDVCRCITLGPHSGFADNARQEWSTCLPARDGAAREHRADAQQSRPSARAHRAPPRNRRRNEIQAESHQGLNEITERRRDPAPMRPDHSPRRSSRRRSRYDPTPTRSRPRPAVRSPAADPARRDSPRTRARRPLRWPAADGPCLGSRRDPPVEDPPATSPRREPPSEASSPPASSPTDGPSREHVPGKSVAARNRPLTSEAVRIDIRSALRSGPDTPYQARMPRLSPEARERLGEPRAEQRLPPIRLLQPNSRPPRRRLRQADKTIIVRVDTARSTEYEVVRTSRRCTRRRNRRPHRDMCAW